MGLIMRSWKVLVSLAALLAVPAAARPEPLSPEQWPETKRLRLERSEAAIWPSRIRAAAGTRGLVTGTASPVAVHAGTETLRQGGTAADAAIATALTQVTMMLGANVSYAGVAEILYFERRTGRVYVLDAGWGSWRGERSPATIPNADISAITGRAPGPAGAAGRKALVPGFMAGMQAFHDRFGRLPLRRLFAPAIWYAEHGVPVTPFLGTYFAMARPVLDTTPEGRAFVARPGERFAPPGLAATLRATARDGARFMYRGAWARHYVEAVRARGGAATLEDMAAYAPRWTEPLSLGLAGGTLFGPDASNPNGCAILMALNLLDHRPPSGTYRDDPAAFRTMALTLRASFFAPYVPEMAAFERRLGLGGSCAARLTPAYGAAAAAALDSLAPVAGALPAGHHSAAVVVVDRWGNVAAVVHSSNTPLWGDTGMIVDGVPVPTPGGLYQSRLAGIAPGGHLPSDMAPMILLRDGRPAAAIATIGTSLVPETVRLMLGIARGEDLAAGLGAPPLLLNVEDLTSPLATRDELVPAGRFPPEFLARVRARGLPVREVDAGRTLVLRGTAVAATITPTGERRAVEVPGVLGFAEAE
jgi:gamma-glutamyltranspeptidase / glutathione hydrolase